MVSEICQDVKIVGYSKLTKVQQLQQQNNCLNNEVKRISSIAAEQKESIAQLQLKVSNLEVKFGEYKENQQEKFTSFSNTQTNVLQHGQDMFSNSLTMYQDWTVGLSIVIALSGVLGFFF